jgi:hypothetical protein
MCLHENVFIFYIVQQPNLFKFLLMMVILNIIII